MKAQGGGGFSGNDYHCEVGSYYHKDLGCLDVVTIKPSEDTFNDAMSVCNSKKMIIAPMISNLIESLVLEIVRAKGLSLDHIYTLGYRDSNGDWYSADNSQMTYTNWDATYPLATGESSLADTS